MTPAEAVAPPVAEKLPPALVEVTTASRKTLQFVAQNRRQVEEMLLTLPELGGDKPLAARLAYIVWDQQGEVRLTRWKLRAAYIEALLNTRRAPKAKATIETLVQGAEPVPSLEVKTSAGSDLLHQEDELESNSKPADDVAASAAIDATEIGKVVGATGRGPEGAAEPRGGRLL